MLKDARHHLAFLAHQRARRDPGGHVLWRDHFAQSTNFTPSLVCISSSVNPYCCMSCQSSQHVHRGTSTSLILTGRSIPKALFACVTIARNVCVGNIRNNSRFVAV